MCNENNCNNCIAEILKVICVLQENATETEDACLNTCDRAFLGCEPTCVKCNTRPVMLYLCCGEPLEMPTDKGACKMGDSDVFRVEKIDGCCATFRVLKEIKCGECYEATDSFFTMNLDCLCIIKCLEDTYVECL